MMILLSLLTWLFVDQEWLCPLAIVGLCGCVVCQLLHRHGLRGLVLILHRGLAEARWCRDKEGGLW